MTWRTIPWQRLIGGTLVPGLVLVVRPKLPSPLPTAECGDQAGIRVNA